MARELLRNDDFVLYAIALKCPHCEAEVVASVRVTRAKGEKIDSYECINLTYKKNCYDWFVTKPLIAEMRIDACKLAAIAYGATKEVAVRTTRHGFDVFAPSIPTAYARN
jgi:hypothetical protein